MNAAILISTFDRYEKLARWTAAQVERQWPQHPPVFYSGLTKQGEQCLGYSGDSKDWMSVTLHAVEQLQQRGFTHAYLILDDHPPVGPCHEEALNEVLPGLALKLHATYIGLLGYGQHRGLEGKILGRKCFFLEQSSIDYRWKFSLHPGLWNLKALHTLLLQRMTAFEGELRTAWNFEQHEDDPHDPKTTFLIQRSYRINGTRFLKKKWQMGGAILCESVERFIADVMLFKAKLTGGSMANYARYLAQKKLFWRYSHYLGPYPLFWSGVMQQGKPNQDWERWLQRSSDRELKASWASVKEEVFGCAEEVTSNG
ncbi:MAG: hypothetical protein NT164_00740 [Verrucomicrobiae bacterium]|nr:hypothetical protein [Verrucomicrobiae bacterium]